MTHGRDCPHRCSQCADAPVRRVAVEDGRVVIDGEVTRPSEPGWSPKHLRSVRRGGRR